MTKTTRRRFLKTAVATGSAATLMKGLPGGWVGCVYADDSPETPNMRFGMIALTDCSPIVMAHELGFFKKFGINSVCRRKRRGP
jgi:nitrate/nitrite transport system substrate-binding protein